MGAPHSVTIKGTEGVGVAGWCSGCDWRGSFAYAGAVEQWARGHLIEVTSKPTNPDGSLPVLEPDDL
jgi:hypothetical protein